MGGIKFLNDEQVLKQVLKWEEGVGKRVLRGEHKEAFATAHEMAIMWENSQLVHQHYPVIFVQIHFS